MTDIVLQMVRDTMVATEAADRRVESLRLAAAVGQLKDDDHSPLAETMRARYEDAVAIRAAAIAAVASPLHLLDELLDAEDDPSPVHIP